MHVGLSEAKCICICRQMALLDSRSWRLCLCPRHWLAEWRPSGIGQGFCEWSRGAPFSTADSSAAARRCWAQLRRHTALVPRTPSTASLTPSLALLLACKQCTGYQITSPGLANTRPTVQALVLSKHRRGRKKKPSTTLGEETTSWH